MRAMLDFAPFVPRAPDAPRGRAALPSDRQRTPVPKQKSKQDVAPDQLSRSLSKSLRKLDKNLARQRREVVDMAQLITLTTAEVAAKIRAAPGSEVALDDAILGRLAAAVRASFTTLEAEADTLELPELAQERGDTLSEELNQALSMAWQNAVEASQSLHTVAEQALTQGLSLLFSVAGEALTEKQELVLDALTPSSAVPGGDGMGSDTRFRDEVGFDDPYGSTYTGSASDADGEDDDWA